MLGLARHLRQQAISGPGYGADDRAVWIPDRLPHSRMSYYGAPQTIQVMSHAALGDANHFETRQLAEVVCEGLDSKDYTSEYLALYQFLLQHTRYMRDPRRVELVKQPYIVSRQILAGHRPSLDCDDMSTWLAAAMFCVGGQPEFATVAFSKMIYQGQQQFSHVFTRVLEPRSRVKIVLDPVAAEKTPTMLSRVKAAKTWPIEG